jgi:hypothetical protein
MRTAHLVAKDIALLHRRNFSMVQVQVRAANSSPCDFDNDIILGKYFNNAKWSCLLTSLHSLVG